MSGAKKIPKDHYLFREGDPSDTLYVIKSGKLAITKAKQNSEIVLAEVGPGAMVGEMAFFDNRPRSASARAVKDAEVICLPFKALHAQFQNFPEWCKAIMRTVNNHLREANARIKSLEKVDTDGEMFSPHQINKLISILNLVAAKYGKQTDEGLQVPQNLLRTFTIQIFQEATHKMQKLMAYLEEIKIMKVEELGEGRQKILILDPETLLSFVEWHNEWLFKKEGERITIREEELKFFAAVLHFSKKLTPNDKGVTKLYLSEIQNESMKELGYLVRIEDLNCFVDYKMVTDKMMEEGKGLYVTLVVNDIEKLLPYWQIIYGLKKITR